MDFFKNVSLEDIDYIVADGRDMSIEKLVENFKGGNDVSIIYEDGSWISWVKYGGCGYWSERMYKCGRGEVGEVEWKECEGDEKYECG